MAKICLWGLLGFLISLGFGVGWAVKTGGIQDGFAVASYVLAFETFTMGTIQLSIGLNWF